MYIAGEAVGALTQTLIGDKLGRIRFMQLMCIIVTIGTVIQTASVNIGMFLAGRVLAGYAVGYVILCSCINKNRRDDILTGFEQRNGSHSPNLPK